MGLKSLVVLLTKIGFFLHELELLLRQLLSLETYLLFTSFYF
nr:MAG TPA_asm: hypothetical protein [Bacteriophage sp.]